MNRLGTKNFKNQAFTNILYLALSFDTNTIHTKIKPKKIHLNYLGCSNLVSNLT